MEDMENLQNNLIETANNLQNNLIETGNNLQNNLIETGNNLQNNENQLQEQINTLNSNMAILNPKYVGTYETDISDYNVNEPFVITTIRDDGKTLSTFYTDSSKNTQYPENDDQFIKLEMMSETTGYFTRNYNTPQNLLSSTGETIMTFLIAEHKYFFTENGNSLYSSSVYYSDKKINVPAEIAALANELGYEYDGSRLKTRLFKRNKINN